MDRLNPYAKIKRAAAARLNKENAAKKSKKIKKDKNRKKASRTFFNRVTKDINDAAAKAIAEEQDIRKQYFSVQKGEGATEAQ